MVTLRAVGVRKLGPKFCFLWKKD